MKLENQVTSLELSKRLKELGVKQESLFARTLDTGQVVPFPDKMFALGMTDEQWNWCSAFTVAELGEMLPIEIVRGLITLRGTVHFNVYFEDNIPQKGFVANTEADARAKMLIYLLENNLLHHE